MADDKIKTNIFFHQSQEVLDAYIENNITDEDTSVIRARDSGLFARQNRLVIILQHTDGRRNQTGEGNFWAGHPQSIHVDAGAFYSRFVQRSLSSIAIRRQDLTIHLVQGPDNERIMRHFAELKLEVETDIPAHKLPIHWVSKLYQPDLKVSIDETLGKASDDALPCALWMNLEIQDQHHINWCPGVWALMRKGDRYDTISLGSSNAGLTKHCAVVGMTAFVSGPQQRAIVRAVHEMGARGRSNSFRAVITRGGVIVTCEVARSTAYTDGIERAVRVIMPHSTSNHEKITACAEMEKLTNIILLSQISHLSNSSPIPREVALTTAD
jgi:hypothetical protein